MKTMYRIVIFLTLFLFSFWCFSNDKLNKKEQKIDKLIELGFFKKAKKENQKFIQYLETKKPSEYEMYLGVAYLHVAQIDAILERDESVFKNDIKQGLDILEKTNFEGKTKGLLRAAEIYTKRGESLKASEYLKEVGESDIEKLSKALQEEYFLAQANVHLDSKGFKRALDFTNTLVKGLDISKKNYYEEKTHILHLQAKILLEQGYYFQADSILRITNTYLEDLPNKSPHRIDFLFLKAIFHDAIDQPQEVINYLEEAYHKLEKIEYALGYAKTCFTYEELMEYLCLTHWSYQNEKEGDKAFNQYKTSLKKHFGDKEFVSQQLAFLMVKKHLLEGQFLEAENELRHFYPFLNEKGNDVFHAKILELKYTIELALARVQEAEKTLKTYVAIFSKIHSTESTIYHYEQLKLANFYIEYNSDLEKALQIYNESFFSSSKKDKYNYYDRVDEAFSSAHYDYIDFKITLAELYVANNEFGKAQKLYEENIYAIDHYYGSGYLIHPIQHLKIADFYLIIGNYKEVLRHLEIAEKALLENFSDAPEYPLCLKKIANYYLETQDFHQAEIVLKQAQKAYKRLDIEDLDEEISEFASLYIEKGQYSKVEKVVVSKLKTITTNYGESSIHLIPEYYKLAELYIFKGEFLEAEDVILKAMKIVEKSSNQSINYAKALKLHGNMYVELGNYAQAMDKYILAMKIVEKQLGKNHLEYAYLLQDYVKASLFLTGVTPENEQQLLEVSTIILDKLGEKSMAYLNTLNDLSLYYLQKKDIQSAEMYFEKEKSIWKQIKEENQSPVTEVELYKLEGELLKQKKEYKQAILSFEKASDLYKTMFDNQHPNYLHTQAQIGKLYYVLGDIDKSIAIFEKIMQVYLAYIQQNFKILSEKEKSDFWTTCKLDFEFYYTLALSNVSKNPKLVDELYYVVMNTKAILLNSSVRIRKQILEGNNDELKQILQSWIEKREEILTINSKTTEELEEENIDKQKLIDEINQLEKQLSKESELFNPHQPTWKDIKKKLEKEEVAVEIVRYRHYTTTFSDSIIYAALVTTSETKKNPHVIFLSHGKDLENKFYHYYANVVKYELKDEHSYHNYWQAIQEYIGEGKTVYLSLEGIYNRVNVEALLMPDGKYVMDKNRIVLVGNTKDILSIQKESVFKKEDNMKAILFGNPTFYDENKTDVKQTVRPLLGAEQEVLLVQDMLNQKGLKIETYLQSKASEPKFKEIQSASILHVATHGFFYPSADEQEFQSKFTAVSNDGMLKSGLIMRNGGYLIDHVTEGDYNQQQGIVTAYEVMNMNLDNTELVVLSACETGLGEIQIGEGVYGLQRAFLIAGANSIIMSLFQVSDEATRELMAFFYKEWLRTGNKQEAFYYAKQEVRKLHPNPLYWGSFVLIEK